MSKNCWIGSLKDEYPRADTRCLLNCCSSIRLLVCLIVMATFVSVASMVATASVVVIVQTSVFTVFQFLDFIL